MLLRLLLLSFFALGSYAHAHKAHQQAIGVVAERTQVMKEIGQASKRLSDMLRGKQAYDAEAVRAAAQFISTSSGASLADLFPAGSDGETSDALPSIWQDWKRFSAEAEQMAAVADALARAADNPIANASEEASAGILGEQSLGLATPTPVGLTPDAIEILAEGPPQSAFDVLVKTCNACHSAFRKPQ